MILALNRGSSSVKFAVYGDALDHPVASGNRRLDSSPIETTLDPFRDFPLRAIGHRVVHGGTAYQEPVVLTPTVLAALKALVPLAPEHLPGEIELIEAAGRRFPGLPQVVCFDTAFHRTMPRVAQLYGLPRVLAEDGILRYGFHGLSYEYIAGELPNGRVVAAHLGNGASLAAIRDGSSVDTSMGFTPSGGIPMGTRSGDLDPAVVLYLLREKKMTPSQVAELVNERSGLLGLSGVSADMGELLKVERDQPAAAEAIAVFCYHAQKYIGAFTAALGGLDVLAFTGGIGENAAAVRERICAGLGGLGIRLDFALNVKNAAVISSPNSPVSVRVIHTNEELIVARHTKSTLK